MNQIDKKLINNLDCCTEEFYYSYCTKCLGKK